MAESRAEVLAKKILLPQNQPLHHFAPKWVADSLQWGMRQVGKTHPEAHGNQYEELVKRYRLKYVLNHLCPSLYHFFPSPQKMLPFQGQDIATKYQMENSQAEFTDWNGNVTQKGAIYSGEEFDKLLSIWKEAGILPESAI